MRALITGASKGIGKALAGEFAKAGYDLVITARDEQLLKELAGQLQNQYSIQVHTLPMDLAPAGAAQKLIQALEETGLAIDCLVNNAGLGYLGEFTEMTQNRLDTMMNLNMVVLTELSHYFAKHWVLENKKGQILQVASIAAFQPGPWMSVYYASKAYVLSFSRALAYELRQKGIVVTTLCPGPTQTAFLHSAKMDDSALARGFLGMMSAEQVAAAAIKALNKGKSYVIPGLLNKILAGLAAISPAAMSMRIAAMFHKR